ncbi:ABC transporter ATP-binding protein [Aquibacillus koreensis]|uniref:ABC transporter ATP-binding protein n=1 Tax=Aquibacillus koreensis TaxID=279446 RepID=A0A9X4AHH4_9BACI|nr:ABC transporter ATP-binding protein [Aquibacillus koreensis]MCT2535588.1 ABC transporter ATP-binding protein [Aquibacillus koreensis]MDC3420127.1 ABC transporter ATP-binding protein [Aquibacillus koreensis]
MSVIKCEKLTKSYGENKALHELSLTVEENKITGLIGRNGAGKTTLLKIIAGYLRKSSGNIEVFSEQPFNNLKVSSNMIFVDDQMNFPTALHLKELLYVAKDFYPNWDMDLAERLFDYFSFHPNERHHRLSKGMKSTFNMIVGLASRCPLTIFDEPTTGMDASVRKDFYRALLKDYIAFPRTIILSSHLLNEMEDILEDILLIRKGEKYLHMPISDVKAYAFGIRGESSAIKEWSSDKEILHQKQIGDGSSYIVVTNTSYKLAKSAKLEQFTISPVAAEDVCIYLTRNEKGDIDHVFNRG